MGNHNSKTMKNTTILSKHSADHLNTVEETEDVSQLTPITPSTVTPCNSLMHISHKQNKASPENGLIGVLISLQSVQISVDFWNTHVAILDEEHQTEIGCSIFFSLIATNKKVKKLFIGKSYGKLEGLGPKFFDMISYAIRSLLKNDDDSYSSLRLLGSLHSKQGIEIQMYQQMISALNETFEYYFSDEYTTDIKHALNEVFSVVSRIMNHAQQNVDLSIDYLRSLNECLRSFHGKAALISYLKEEGCDDMVLCYDLLDKFKAEDCDSIQRLMIARDIIQLNTNDEFEISSETRKNILADMRQLDDLFMNKVPFELESTFFHHFEHEINAFVSRTYWNDFKHSTLAC